ncbi:MAG TPA: hypothetical protein VHY83_10485 [Solirubrobacteraceae bacterium]|nr:hypothetical protein [Solirubrobacteraceae bacterium]
MATSLADPAPATIDGSAPVATPGAPGPDAPSTAPAPDQRTCANCGSPMSPGQDWCLQCGTGAPGSLGTSRPPWRSGAGILIATAVLALAAAGAGYAALSKGKARTVGVTRTVAQVTPPPAVAPGTTTVPPATVPKVGTPTTIKPSTPLPTTTPPKIPLTAVTPKIGTTSTPAATNPSSTTTTPSSGSGESQPQALLLDTNAAQTYNPYAYPAAGFGDPSLAIDGETATGWTAQVDPAVAPKMAEGLVIDLKSARKISAVALVTTTPGMTVQVYGTAAQALPASITDPAWVKLSPSLPVKSKHMRIKLKSAKAVRFVTLWISRAPASSVGTPQAPGRVSVNELELFP